MENTENNSKVCQTFSIKAYPEDIERFNRLKAEMDGVNNSRGALIALMDFFENPKTIKVQDPELINRIAELNKRAEEAERRHKEAQQLAARLQAELDSANEQLSQQDELSRNDTRPENVIEIEVHPVPFHFLKKMAEHLSKQKNADITPGYILSDLFIKDLQNPLSNNLPYTVSTSEIERVLNAYKREHPEEYK